jgi:S-disulfanyl-L-cysteine oxidoreductase SoxD
MNIHSKLAGAALLGLAALGGSSTALHAQGAGKTVWDGVYSEAQGVRGKAVYDARCASCHGMGLEGADVAPSLVGDRFTAAWQGQTVGGLVTRVRTTMPLDDPGSMGMKDSVDVVAYILKQNQTPAGAAELPAEAAPLEQIRFAPKN